MEKKQTIAAVIVTYNRKELLKNCLEALLNQSYVPDKVFIIDNASTDGTELFVTKFIDGSKLFEYIRLDINYGGAGGFHEGIKHAYENNYDWIWLMDDDGIAEANQLQKLISISDCETIFNPLVIDIDNHEKLAFSIGENRFVSEVLSDYIGEINPFNGTFFSRSIVAKIGNVKKEMFIWGDEKEYILRAKKHGIRMLTVKDALHYHPKGVIEIANIWGLDVPLKPSERMHIFIRNLGYIAANYYSFLGLLKLFLTYFLFFLSNSKTSKPLKMIRYFMDGVFNKYSLPI